MFENVSYNMCTTTRISLWRCTKKYLSISNLLSWTSTEIFCRNSKANFFFFLIIVWLFFSRSLFDKFQHFIIKIKIIRQIHRNDLHEIIKLVKIPRINRQIIFHRKHLWYQKSSKNIEQKKHYHCLFFL